MATVTKVRRRKLDPAVVEKRRFNRELRELRRLLDIAEQAERTANFEKWKRHTYTVVHCEGRGFFDIKKVRARSAHEAMTPHTGRRMTADEIAAWKTSNQRYSK